MQPVRPLQIMHTHFGRYPEPFRDFADFLPAACNFSTIVFATFPEHHGHVLEQLQSRACPSQQLIFVVHNPEELLQPGAAACLPGRTLCAWSTLSLQQKYGGIALKAAFSTTMRKCMPRTQAGIKRMLSSLDAADSHFLALAPHTTAAVNDALQELGRHGTAQLFVPVFPINTGAPAAASRQGFVLQGLLEAHRWLPSLNISHVQIDPAGPGGGRECACAAAVRAGATTRRSLRASSAPRRSCRARAWC